MTVHAKYQFLRETYKERITGLLIAGEQNTNTGRATLLKEKRQDAFSGLSRIRRAQHDGIDLPQDKLAKYQNDIFDAFSQMLDPTHNRSGGGKAYKYLHWICAQFLEYRHNDKPMLIEDFYKHRNNLRDFEAWSARLYEDGTPNQIDDAALAKDGFRALQNLLRPYQHEREVKQEKRALHRLSPAQKKEIEDGTTMLYEGAEGRVVMIHNWAASKFWGTHTEWCITSRDEAHYFTDYHRKSPIIFYLPTPTPRDYTQNTTHTSFKFAAVQGHIWDEHDNTQENHFPECLHKLAIAVRQHYEDKGECLAFIDGYARAKQVADDVFDHNLRQTETLAPAAKQAKPVSEDINYDDCEEIITAMDDDLQLAEYHFSQISENLRGNPEFLIKALHIQSKAANISNVKTVPVSNLPEFQALTLSDPDFLLRALKVYGGFYNDLPCALRQREDIALLAIETYPKGIIDILNNTTTLREMYSDNTDHRKSFKDKRMQFLTRAMLSHPGVTEFLDYIDDINAINIPFKAWLDAFDAHPYALASGMQNWQNWFINYISVYNHNLDHSHSPREMVIRSYATATDVLKSPSSRSFHVLAQHRPDILNDPEVFLYNTIQAKNCYHKDAQHILLAACKKDLSLFSVFNEEDHQNPSLMREVLRHVIETGQQLAFARHLRFLPFSSSKHPETLMSCEAVLRVIDTAFPNLAPWRDFQDVINDYRTAQTQKTHNEKYKNIASCVGKPSL